MGPVRRMRRVATANTIPTNQPQNHPQNSPKKEHFPNKFCKPFANRACFSEKNKKKTPDFTKEIRGLLGGRTRTRTVDPLIKSRSPLASTQFDGTR